MPTIRALRSHFESIAAQEVERALQGLKSDATDAQQKAIKRLGNGLINKLLHEPMVKLREKSAQADPMAHEYFTALETLFDLELLDETEADIETVRKAAEEAEEAGDPEERKAS